MQKITSTAVWLSLFVFVCTWINPGFSSRVHAVAPSAGAGTSLTLSEIFACQKDAPNDQEWVEVYNPSSSEIDLTGWKIGKNKSGTASLSGTLASNAYKKVLFPSGFANDGFAVTLTEPNGTDPIESFPIAYKSDKTTTEKCSSDILSSWIKEGENWKLTSTISPDASNTYTAIATPTPSPSATPSPSPSPTSSPTPSPSPSATPGAQPTSVSLSEIYACQTDGTKEWVELANSASTSVTITNWKLTDDDNNEQPIASLTIPAKGFAVVEISKYVRGMLTNDGDVVTIYDAVGKKVDSYEYSECASDQTWAKIAGTWKQTTSMTKGQVNPTSGTPSPSPEPSDLPEGDGGGEVLGAETTTETPSPSLEPTPIAQSTSGTTVIAFLCIGIGVLTLTGLGGYLAWEPYLKKHVNRLLKRN